MFDVTIISKRAALLLKTAAKQVPFATSVAINETAKDFQRVQVAHIEEAFTIRRQTFARRAVKIKPFATKRQLTATVSIDPPGGRAEIFAKFERGGTKRPRGQHIAVPVGISTARVIPKGKWPRRLLERPNMFALRQRRGKLPPGIYRRLGARRAGKRVKLMYVLKRSVPIDARLDFLETGRRVVRQRFGRNFQRAYAKALRTAR